MAVVNYWESQYFLSMKYEPISGREFPRFSAINSFFRLPIDEPNGGYDVGIFGIPYDGACSYRPGSRFAPSKIREMSSLGRGFHMTREINFIEKINVADIGDAPTVPIDQIQTYQRVEKFTSELLENDKRFIAVGGDHSLTLPLLRSIHAKYGKVNLIHFDAHLDTYPAAWGCEYHHGAFVRHAVNEGLVNAGSSVQIGIRGPLASNSDTDFSKAHGLTVYSVDDIRKQHEIDLKLPEFKGPTYISFDIDCLDPAYAPGTGTPVPGGLTTYETQRILRQLKIENLVGSDIVEVAPAYDPSDITSIAAVDVMFEMLCLYADASGRN